MTQDNKLQFKVNVQLKSVVGQDLILDDNIAIIELVKNAYDANSKYVNVIFNNIKHIAAPKASSIIIEDGGFGMDLNDIKNKWLNIAYSEKKSKRHIENRYFAGSKGVGRFSCDRLGSYLDIYTKKYNEKIFHIEIDWKNFEIDQQNIEIGHIPITYNIVKESTVLDKFKINNFDNGTILFIQELRRPWPKNKLESLKSSLEKFASPHTEYEEDSFQIYLRANEYLKDDNETSQQHKKINGKISNKIFDKLSFKSTFIETTIDKNGDEITSTLTHRGNRLFTLVENNIYKHLKGTKIITYYLNQYHKAYFTKQTGIRSVDFGSIFLFLNGFRVSPYGNRGNDWLGLDVRKAQGQKRYFGSRDIVGRIEVSDPKGEWRIVSSREGLVENILFDELTNKNNGLFYNSLRKLETFVVEGLKWDSTKDKRIDEAKVLARTWNDSKERYSESESVKEKRILSILKGIVLKGTDPENIILLEFDPHLANMLQQQKQEEIEEFFIDFENLDGDVSKLSLSNNLKKLQEYVKEERKLHAAEKKYYIEQTKELQEKATKAKEQANKYEQTAIQREKENLFLKATSGRDIEDVIDMHHQILVSTSIIKKDTSFLLKKLSTPDAQISRSKFKNIIDRISFQNDKIAQISKFATRANFKLSTQEITSDIISFIDQYVNEIERGSYFKGIHIDHISSEKAKYNLRFKPIEITILIDNMIKNSKKASATSFRIDTTDTTKDKLIIYFHDDGKGLSPDIIDGEDIFRRGFTTTSGSGLGLHIVKKIAANLDGSITICSNANLGGISFEFRRN